MFSDNPFEPLTFDANDMENIVTHLPVLRDRHLDSSNSTPEFVVGSITRGITPELIDFGYTHAVMPWPTLEQVRDNMYPWGRVSRCTVIKTDTVHLPHGLKKRVRDALARHYDGNSIEILLDRDYEAFVDTVADHYYFSIHGTWLSNAMKSCWKQAHRKGLTHCITIMINGRIAGGLLFGTKGGMLYGETAMSWLPDASKLALVALCAIARHCRMPLIDCQMYSPYVSGFNPEVMDWATYLPLQSEAVSRTAPDWEKLPRELTGIIAGAFPELKPRPYTKEPRSLRAPVIYLKETDEKNRHDPNEIEPNTSDDPDDVRAEDLLTSVCMGTRHVALPVISRPCSYFSDRRSRFEIFSFNQNATRENNAELYSLTSCFGFRREVNFMSRPACHGCKRCLSTRIDVQRFKFSANMRRILKRNGDLTAELRPISGVSDEYMDLYYRYVNSRHADSHMKDFSRKDVEEVLFSSSTVTYALEIRTSRTSEQPGKLVMVCIVDQLDNAISAVYNFFDPDYEKQSLGTFGILSEILFAKRMNLSYVYLGYWLRDYPGMDYKRRFAPMSVYYEERWMDINEYLALTDASAKSL